MNKSILFIFLELFTIRHFSYYCPLTIKSSRRFIMNMIDDFDDLLQFKLNVLSKGAMLSTEEYLFVRNFIQYLNSIDNIVKM